MAASMDSRLSSIELEEDLFQQISVQFLEMVPIRRMKWQAQLVGEDQLGPDCQRRLLHTTILSPLCRRYPPALSYQRAFLKKLLHKLEECGVEICDEVYEAYTGILGQGEEEDEDTLCYKTYTLCPGNTVTLQESVNMISCGTTGLSTWQAAQHLAEWALQNKHLLENKNVLELGSGLGLTGIVTCRQCNVHRFTFTDCHSRVLRLVAQNIELNFGTKSDPYSPLTSTTGTITACDKSECQDSCIMQTISPQSCSNASLDEDTVTNSSNQCQLGEHNKCSGCAGDDIPNSVPGQLPCWQICDDTGLRIFRERRDIQLACLDWDCPTENLLRELEETTDVILAADVVFDKSSIPSLVALLKHLLIGSGRTGHRCAYVASTIRNEDTRDQFLISLSGASLQFRQEVGPVGELFHYDRTVPIEILQITGVDPV